MPITFSHQHKALLAYELPSDFHPPSICASTNGLSITYQKYRPLFWALQSSAATASSMKPPPGYQVFFPQ